MTADTMDTLGKLTTVTSIGGAAIGEMSPHPLQLWVWGIAIVSGLVAITLGCIRIVATIKKINSDE